MRPIDADALLDYIQDLVANAHDQKYQKGLQDAIDYYFPMIIDDQPTIGIVANDVSEEVQKMSINKKREILDMLVSRYNERCFLAATAGQNDLLAISYTNRTMARDLLDIINELAYGELVDINHVNSHYANGVVCDEIVVEWA